MARTIQSPGVEIKEVDLSLRPQLPAGTSVFATGFASRGPTEEIIQVASLSEFEQIYGKPTNAAERYFYHTVTGIFQSQANVLLSRLPYGSGLGDTSADKYSALVYPVVALSGSMDGSGQYLQGASGGIPTDGLQGQTYKLLAGAVADFSLSAADTYYIAPPATVSLTESEYQKLIDGQFTWDDSAKNCATIWGDSVSAMHMQTSPLSSLENIGKSSIIILNKRKNTINERFEGQYIGLKDNTDLNPASDYDSIIGIRSLNKTNATSLNGASPIYSTGSTSNGEYVSIPESRLTFALSAAGQKGAVGSIAQDMEDIFANDADFGTDEYSDMITLGIFKIRQSTLDPDVVKLDKILLESYTGSLNYFRELSKQDGTPSSSKFLENETLASNNIKILVNPYISKYGGDWLDSNGKPTKRVRMMSNQSVNAIHSYLDTTEQTQLSGAREYLSYSSNATRSESRFLHPSGVFKEASVLGGEVGEIPSKLDNVFELVDNHEIHPIDITVDGGLSTIWAGSSGGKIKFDDEAYFNIGDATTGTGLYQTKIIGTDDPVAGDTIANYREVTNRFVDFAANKRKDNIFISDPLRYVFVQGANSKVLSDKAKNFSQHVYWPLKHTYNTVNTSYAAAYANWGKAFDESISKQVWLPMSGKIAALYANTDSTFQPWIAPAGFTRGVLNTVNDLALYPKQKHRDQLYKIRLNPIANFPNDGFVVYGQKTMQTKPSAFDRVNVRRLFLNLEKATRSTVKYFVFEPNTLFTRTQVVNVLTPIFENAKQTQGLYDYIIICDERNNTPDVIDQNELVVDIYLKPVRASEFILVNFYATRTGQDFSEILS
jgi:hypothetical protein